jgi:hypothetical protein
MTLSTQTRRCDLDDVVRILITRLGDDSVADQWVTPSADQDLQSALSTTWDELLRFGWVTKMAGGPPPFFRLTGLGWYEGLPLIGKLDAVRASADTFLKAVKAKVDRENDELACVHDFAPQGLPSTFVFNAVDANLLAHLHPGRGYGLNWSSGGDPYSAGAAFFIIPRGFGHAPLHP